jgi:2-polyprenyl-3-methyl-5-hydroxy-6-metoxy-1,4-benzoquinol methylase
LEAAYRQAYEKLYREHWWWRAREEWIVAFLRERRPAGGWGRILDVGCGNGLFFDRLAEFGEVEGVEPSHDLVEAESAYRARIHIGPFDERFQPEKRYGLILMLDVLEHLDNPAGALRRATGLLGPGGFVLITVPAFRALWTNHDVLNQHRARFTKSSFRRLASQAGFRILESRYFFHWMFPAKVAARVFEELRGAPPAVPVVPAAWLNRLLLRVSRIEQGLFRPLPLPFGSSLLVLGTGDPQWP